MQLSVIIVNYNVKYFLEHCLLSAVKACRQIEAEIFVVDNHSTDGSEAYLTSRFPGIKFLWNKTNPGFAKANNSVLPQTTGKYVLFLNPDTLVPEDCFTKCVAFFEMHADCGGLGVRMIDGNGKFLRESKRSLPSVSGSFFKMIGLAEIFPSSKLFSDYYAGHLPEHTLHAVEVLAGAFMMLSRKAVTLTKGFDEDFFMYGEDVDLSYRIIKSGLKNYYFPDTTIIHFKGESTHKQSTAYTAQFYHAMKLFVEKHYGAHNPKRVLLKCGISLRKHIALLKRKKAGTKESTNLPVKKLLLAGAEKDRESVKKIINDAGLRAEILTDVIADPGAFKHMISEKQPTAVVFCEGDHSVKLAITLSENLPSDTEAFYHLGTAQSIVGSSDKNSRGIFISKR